MLARSFARGRAAMSIYLGTGMIKLPLCYPLPSAMMRPSLFLTSLLGHSSTRCARTVVAYLHLGQAYWSLWWARVGWSQLYTLYIRSTGSTLRSPTKRGGGRIARQSKSRTRSVKFRPLGKENDMSIYKRSR